MLNIWTWFLVREGYRYNYSTNYLNQISWTLASNIGAYFFAQIINSQDARIKKDIIIKISRTNHNQNSIEKLTLKINIE